MNTIPELVALHDCRPGLRTLLHVEVGVPSPDRHVDGSEAGDQGASAGVGEAVLDFVASTATMDRYQEIIEPAGWRLEAYRRNPVFQNAHNYGDILFTLGRAVTTEVREVGGRQALCQRIQFATEVNPVARIAFGLYRGGFLKAVSVGFIPLKWEDATEVKSEECRVQNEDSERTHLTQPSPPAERGKAPRRRYLEQELLEVSAVAIPANPDALALSVKSGAVTKADLRDAMDLLRTIVGADCPQRPERSEWLELARELRRVMRRA